MAREEVPMSLRRAIVEADTRSLNVAEFCRQHGVSSWFFWDLRRRHAREGDVVLEPKSRAPHHPAGRTPAEVEEAVVRKRKELYDAGWDCGPASIASALRDVPGLPHEATIWRILSARGLISPAPSKAPKHTGRSFTAERANECWALDDWTWTLADGTDVQILDVLDDHSRLAVACTAMPTCTGAATFDAIADAASHLGWPQRFWSDNARAFTGTLATALAPLGVAASHTRPYSPRSNGKVERFHQTEHNGSPSSHPPPPSPSCRPSSSCSASTTTPVDHTGRSIAASPPTSGVPLPSPDPPTAPSPLRPASITAPSTPPRPTPAATPSPSAGLTTTSPPSPSSPAPAPTSSSTDASSANSPSTPTSGPNPSTHLPSPRGKPRHKREGCLATGQVRHANDRSRRLGNRTDDVPVDVLQREVRSPAGQGRWSRRSPWPRAC